MYNENNFEHEVLLKANDVALILNISRAMAYSLMQRGEIPAIHFGCKTVRVKVSDLRAYIARNRSGD